MTPQPLLVYLRSQQSKLHYLSVTSTATGSRWCQILARLRNLEKRCQGLLRSITSYTDVHGSKWMAGGFPKYTLVKYISTKLDFLRHYCRLKTIYSRRIFSGFYLFTLGSLFLITSNTCPWLTKFPAVFTQTSIVIFTQLFHIWLRWWYWKFNFSIGIRKF